MSVNIALQDVSLCSDPLDGCHLDFTSRFGPLLMQEKSIGSI
jgi:hypothetical protein